ncbi:ribokinase isoform X2 [Cucumis melo var. makuwa]|uniref:Ribokinase isoform X2 n=1 Tax=Cucumis melo var. makuwa TaxID=1194695 RepID=A0A5D3D636_CUCMM|nr:ribokinase isoform X2 [Cucumis melo var. makuwa]
MVPDDLSRSSLLSALDGARIVYSDVRLHETALLVAQEAARQNIPMLIDAERKREGLDDLLTFASYVVCSTRFPQEWTDTPTIPSALVSMLLRLPKLRFVIVTLGENGCIMLERSTDETYDQMEEFEVNNLLEVVKSRRNENINVPTSVSSPVAKLRAEGIGTVCGRLLLGTAEKIPESEIVDTTGAGDAFIGAVLYALCANMPPEKLLPFSAQVVLRPKNSGKTSSNVRHLMLSSSETVIMELDIDQTLDNTSLDGNQIEEIATQSVLVVDAQISATMDEWFRCLQTTPVNMISPSLPPLSSSAIYNVLYTLLHVLPLNSVKLPLLLQSNLYVLPPTDSATNVSYHLEVENPQIHSRFEVGESLTHVNPNVQASSSNIAY